jgi:hypothetical protein
MICKTKGTAKVVQRNSPAALDAAILKSAASYEGYYFGTKFLIGSCN